MSARDAATLVILGLTVSALAGCTAIEPESNDDATAGDDTVQVAERFAEVSAPHELTGGTLLEGPVIGPDGDLYVVDVMAPAGEPKVLAVDLDNGEVTTVFTDDASAFTSAQFSPLDGRLYLTDFAGGTIRSVTAEGDDARLVHDGMVDGVRMLPDDISFDDSGNLFVTDSQGYASPGWEATGRLVRIDGDTASASVLAAKFSATNGIAFTPECDALWVSNNTGNRIDYVRLTKGGTAVSGGHPALHVDLGSGQVDSLATDADGNLYIGVHGQPSVLVFSPDGDQIGEITVPGDDRDGLSSATNLAIEPGSTKGYITASGPAGGFIYRFTALAEGIRSSNGG